MAIPEVIFKAVAMQNNSQWPCSMCPIPLSRLVSMRTSVFLIFPGHPEFWTLLQIPLWGDLLAASCYEDWGQGTAEGTAFKTHCKTKAKSIALPS